MSERPGADGDRASPRLPLHVWTVWALAWAPACDLIARHPQFLVANDLGPARLVVVLAAVLLVLPLPLVAAAAVLRARPTAGPLLLSPGVALLTCALTRRWLPGWWPLAAAVAVTTIVIVAYRRRAAVRRYFDALAPVALVAPALLLWSSSGRPAAAERAASGALPEGASTVRSIVVVVLDELPITTLLDDDGRLDGRRFPALSRLAATATWYDDVVSVASDTAPAVGALLTGRRLDSDQPASWRHLPDNLFTLLAPRYRIHALEPVTRLCPIELNRSVRARRRLGDWSVLADVAVVALHSWVPEVGGEWLPSIHTGWGGFLGDGAGRPGGWLAPAAGAADRVGQFEAWLDGIGPADGGAGPGDLYFAHLLLPHRPWAYLPDGSVYRPDGRHEVRVSMNPRWPDEPAIVEREFQRHLLQAEFTDRLLGRLIDRLVAVDRFDASLVMVVADHGISFRPGELMRRRGERNVEDLEQVPLLIKLPFQSEARRQPRQASTIDVLPTLLDLIGAEPPPRTAGRPLAPGAGAGSSPSRAWSGLRYRRQVFGPLIDGGELFAFGPAAPWAGRSLVDVDAPVHDRWSVELPRGRELRVERRPGALPAWVYGFVDGATAAERPAVALAVDGAIVATAASYPLGDRLRFNAVLPPAALPPGDHRLDLLLIGGDDRPFRPRPD